jgi:hypothetical protein
LQLLFHSKLNNEVEAAERYPGSSGTFMGMRSFHIMAYINSGKNLSSNVKLISYYSRGIFTIKKKTRKLFWNISGAEVLRSQAGI